MAAFNNDHYQARATGQGEQAGVHIASRRPGSSAVLVVRVERLEEEVAVTVGETERPWTDVATTVGSGLLAGAMTYLDSALKKEKTHPGMIPLVAAGLLFKQLPATVRDARLDQQVWFVVEQVARSRKELAELSRKLLTCSYCHVVNQVGAAACASCGAPLAKTVECPHCGLVNRAEAATCGGCGASCGQAVPAHPARACACGAPATPGDRFCGECGRRLG